MDLFFKVSGHRECLAAIEALKVGESPVKIGESATLIDVEVDSFAATGADHIAIRLKPSKRLVELVAALRAPAV
jgi:hypothetical protein